MEIKTSKFIVRIHEGNLTEEERKVKIRDASKHFFIRINSNSINPESGSNHMCSNPFMDD